MRNKLYWGLGILIVLLIGAFVFVMVNQHAENQQLEAEAKKAQDKANQIKEQDALKNNPPVAREGYKMVRHGDHWHEVRSDLPEDVIADNMSALIGSPPNTSNENPEQKEVSLLTKSELDELYQKLSKEFSSMKSDKELEKGPDLSQYSPKQQKHLLTTGIDLSLLPIEVQEKLENFQWRQQGLDTPPPGYTYVQNADGSYRLHNKKDPVLNIQIEKREDGSKYIKYMYMGSMYGGDMDGKTDDEILDYIMEQVDKELEKESNEQ